MSSTEFGRTIINKITIILQLDLRMYCVTISMVSISIENTQDRRSVGQIMHSRTCTNGQVELVLVNAHHYHISIFSCVTNWYQLPSCDASICTTIDCCISSGRLFPNTTGNLDFRHWMMSHAMRCHQHQQIQLCYIQDLEEESH